VKQWLVVSVSGVGPTLVHSDLEGCGPSQPSLESVKKFSRKGTLRYAKGRRVIL
jgi:hypothetical protein